MAYETKGFSVTLENYDYTCLIIADLKVRIEKFYLYSISFSECFSEKETEIEKEKELLTDLAPNDFNLYTLMHPEDILKSIRECKDKNIVLINKENTENFKTMVEKCTTTSINI